MIRIRKIMTAMLIACLITGGVPTAFMEGHSIVANAATVKISKTSLTITEGEVSSLYISGTKQKVTWKSSKPSVVTISKIGLVTAKKAGTATITGTVGKKKYSCKVTVKEKFNASKVEKDIKVRFEETKSHVIGIFKNNSKYNIWLEPTLVFYDSKGQIIDIVQGQRIFCFESGKEGILGFKKLTDDYNQLIPYSHYKISYKISNSNFRKSNVSGVKVTSSITDDKIIIKATNTTKQYYQDVDVAIILYQDGKPINYWIRGMKCYLPGQSVTFSISTYSYIHNRMDNPGLTIKTYVNYAKTSTEKPY